MRYMLDTNICIYAIKHKPEQVFIRLKEHDPQELCISSGTYAELVHGVEKAKRLRKIGWLWLCCWQILIL